MAWSFLEIHCNIWIAHRVYNIFWRSEWISRENDFTVLLLFLNRILALNTQFLWKCSMWCIFCVFHVDWTFLMWLLIIGVTSLFWKMLYFGRNVLGAISNSQAKPLNLPRFSTPGNLHMEISKNSKIEDYFPPGRGGGLLPYKRLMGCAAGWSRIFTTGLTIMGSHFQ